MTIDISKAHKPLVLFLLWTATSGVVIVTAWLLLPTLREYFAIRALLASVDRGGIDRTLRESIDWARRFDRGMAAIGPVSERLANEDSDVRLRAALTLVRLEENTAAAVSSLVEVLERSEPISPGSPRLAAAHALIELGELARPAVMQLAAKYRQRIGSKYSVPTESFACPRPEPIINDHDTEVLGFAQSIIQQMDQQAGRD